MICQIRTALSLVAATALASIAGVAGADAVMHGRVSFTDQSALVKGATDADWSYAGVNSLIMPGDTVWADEQSALEIEFSGGTFLRLADGSRLDVVETPPSALFVGATGSFYVHRVRRSNGDVTFDTPLGAIDVAPDTQVRVDILEGGATTVTVRWGKATIHSEGGAPVTLSTGERSFIDPGFLPATPIVFDRTQEDEFDTWSRSRARQLAEGSAGTPIQSSYANDVAPMGVSDLNGYGEWVYIDNTPYWRPTVVDYVPYRYGSWSYVPAQGYVWVDYYPWAYTTTHYGYWSYRPRYGWCWSYAGYYRPAYAYTVRYGDRFIWAPLSVYGYPVCYDSYASFSIGGVYFSYGFSSYCYDRYVWAGGYHNVWGVDYNCIYDGYNRYRYKDCDYWRIDVDKRPYKNAGQPHWPGDRADTFAPDRVYRGAPVKPDGTMRAGDRVRTLEARNPVQRSNQGPAVRTARNPSNRPTNPALANGGRTRDVRLTDPTATRLARGSDLVRKPGEGLGTRSYTNDDARNAAPLSRGSLADQPRTPSARTNAARETSAIPSGRPSVDNAPRPTRANDTAGSERPGSTRSVSTRSLRPDTAEPTRGGRVDNFPIERPRPTTTRPVETRPDRGPTFGGVEDYPTERPRPTTTRPVETRPDRGPTFGGVEDYPTTERPRPTTTRPVETRPNREPVFGGVEDYPAERPRPTTTRPQVANDRQQVTRPTPERPAYNQPTTNRPQQQVSRPSPQLPSYQRSTSNRLQPQVSRPQPQVSRPEPQRPSYSAPQPSRQAPQPSYQAPPSRSAPQPSFQAPSRSSSPSFSAPSRSSSGSRGGGASGPPSSRSSGGGGPSRSRGGN